MSPGGDETLETKVRQLLQTRSALVDAGPVILDDVHRRAGRLRARRRAVGTVLAAVVAVVAVLAGTGVLRPARHAIPAGPTPGVRHDGMSYDWPSRGPLAGDRAMLRVAEKAAEEGHWSEGRLLDRRALWAGPVSGGYVYTLFRDAYGTPDGRPGGLTLTAAIGRRDSTGRWVFTNGAPGVSDLAHPDALTVAVLRWNDTSATAATVLLLTAPDSGHRADIATDVAVDADGKLRWTWRPVAMHEGVGQVDVPVDRLAATTLRMRRPSGQLVITNPYRAGREPTILPDNTWNHLTRVGERFPTAEWARRHTAIRDLVRVQWLWTGTLTDGTPVQLNAVLVSGYGWAVLTTGQGILSDRPLPPADLFTGYDNLPEISGYLSRPTGGCDLVVVAPKRTTALLLDGAPLPFQDGVSVSHGDRCSGGTLTVRNWHGDLTYQGPVDSDR